MQGHSEQMGTLGANEHLALQLACSIATDLTLYTYCHISVSTLIVHYTYLAVFSIPV